MASANHDGQAERCLCGCGGEPSPGRRYLPGHDSTLRKNIREAIEAGTKIKIYGKNWDPIDYVREHDVHFTTTELMAAENAGINLTRKRRGRKPSGQRS